MQRLWKSMRILGVVAILASMVALPMSAQQPEGIPGWVEADWEYWTQGSGRWIADIRAFKSEAEPYDAYGLEWKWGLGKKTLTGRLFAIRDGKEIGTMMNYRSYWHPAEKKLCISSFGSDGTLGLGTMQEAGATRTEALERFFSPSGATTRVAFQTERLPAEAHNSSFDVMEDGTRKLRRSYVFKLEGAR